MNLPSVGPKCDSVCLKHVAKQTSAWAGFGGEHTMRDLFRKPALVAAACHSGAPGDTEPAAQTQARIENRGSIDITGSVSPQ